MAVGHPRRRLAGDQCRAADCRPASSGPTDGNRPATVGGCRCTRGRWRVLLSAGVLPHFCFLCSDAGPAWPSAATATRCLARASARERSAETRPARPTFRRARADRALCPPSKAPGAWVARAVRCPQIVAFGGDAVQLDRRALLRTSHRSASGGLGWAATCPPPPPPQGKGCCGAGPGGGRGGWGDATTRAGGGGGLGQAHEGSDVRGPRPHPRPHYVDSGTLVCPDRRGAGPRGVASRTLLSGPMGRQVAELSPDTPIESSGGNEV